MNQPVIPPLLLQAQVAVPVGGGSASLVDPTKLENPFGAPMWLDEVRFRIPTEANGNAGEGWSSFSVKLQLGNLPLTNGHVPIGLFGKVLNDSATAEFTTPGVGTYTWKLPKPLYIGPREFLRPTVYFQTYAGAVAKTVTVLYACRPLSKGTPPPRTLQVPWLTYFLPSFLATGGADQVDQSTPSDLYNPWDQDLHVQRFMGRFMGQGTSGEGATNMGLASATVNLATGLISYGTLVSAQDSFNNILVRDRTPFAHVFDAVDRAWTVNCVLPPKGFYLFNTERLWSGYAQTPITATVGISMVGWREVQYLP